MFLARHITHHFAICQLRTSAEHIARPLYARAGLTIRITPLLEYYYAGKYPVPIERLQAQYLDGRSYLIV